MDGSYDGNDIVPNTNNWYSYLCPYTITVHADNLYLRLSFPEDEAQLGRCSMWIMETFVLYLRLVLYPLLAYSLVIEGLSADDCKSNHKNRIYVLFAFFFMMLWGSSIIYYITKDNVLVVNYNTFALLPVAFIILFSVWYKILTRCKRLHKEARLEKENK
jgi:hypothetical protein